MSDVIKIVDSLEEKIKKLISKVELLEKNNKLLMAELSESESRQQESYQQIENLQSQITALKIANALLGSDDFKRETKTRINSLIREIDYCVAQLSD
jgi:TolA-binding protein